MFGEPGPLPGLPVASAVCQLKGPGAGGLELKFRPF